jgi:hypothetical protein
MNFDAPDSLQACLRRERSNTPLQALNLLNDPVFVEAAQGLAVRVLRERPGEWIDQLDHVFKLCLGRGPRPTEVQLLKKYFLEEQERLRREPQSIEMRFRPQGVEGVHAADAAAWVGLSSILLNRDEFTTRR